MKIKVEVLSFVLEGVPFSVNACCWQYRSKQARGDSTFVELTLVGKRNKLTDDYQLRLIL